MRSPFRKFQLALMTGMLLLPLGCGSDSDTSEPANGTDQSAIETPASPDVEAQVIAENTQSVPALEDAGEPVVIELPESFTSSRKAALIQPVRVEPAVAVTEVAAVDEEPLEVAVVEATEEETVKSERVTEETTVEEVSEEPAEKQLETQPATPLLFRSTVPQVADIDEQATHYQAGLIEVSKGENDPHQINAFCLDAKGQIIAACGAGPGEIRVLDADGQLLKSWEVAIKPEAINVAKDGTILVGGHGKLMRFSPDGKQLASAESPHAEGIRKNKEKMRAEVVQRLQSRVSTRNSLATRVKTYENIIAQLEQRKKEGTIGEQEEQILASLPRTLEIMKQQLAEQPEEEEEPKVNEALVEEQLKDMIEYKMRVSSISSDAEHVYVATYALEGYSFNVWQLDQDFTNAKVVVDNLRGCCGQMDVQVNDGGIFVAENARFRVACFDAKGELKTAWGKGDRTGADGFTSCCNPMNVCFSKNGDVFTAESNTGRIKRFTKDGQLKNFIGDVKLVPGCKNVSIAVSPDGDRVYMLDITRNHIVLMKKKSEKPAEEKSAEVTLNN